jgi:hypothetical protein
VLGPEVAANVCPLSDVTRKGRRGACRSSPERRACRLPGDVGLVDARGEVLARISTERVDRTPGNPALQGPRSDYLTIGRVDGAWAARVEWRRASDLSLSRAGLIRVV